MRLIYLKVQAVRNKGLKTVNDSRQRKSERCIFCPVKTNHNRLIIPDPNDRVQATIDRRGIALWDSLVQNELDSGELSYLSDVPLEDAGYYLVYPTQPARSSAVMKIFVDWIGQQR